MKFNDDIGQVAHQLRCETSTLSKLIEKVRLRKAAHLEYPIDYCAVVEAKMAVRAPIDRAHAKVNRRRCSFAPDGLDVDHKVWTPAYMEVVKAAAEDPKVTRIFVNAAIKKEVCAAAQPSTAMNSRRLMQPLKPRRSDPTISANDSRDVRHNNFGSPMSHLGHSRRF